MNIPQETIDQILDLKSQMYTKGSIVREVKKATKDKKVAQDYVEYVLSERQQHFNDNPEKRLGDIQSALISSSVTCAVVICLAIAISAITNGQFRATGGLLLLGLVSGVIAFFKLMQFAYYKVQLGNTDTSTSDTHEIGDVRTWEDLE